MSDKVLEVRILDSFRRACFFPLTHYLFAVVLGLLVHEILHEERQGVEHRQRLRHAVGAQLEAGGQAREGRGRLVLVGDQAQLLQEAA